MGNVKLNIFKVDEDFTYEECIEIIEKSLQGREEYISKTVRNQVGTNQYQIKGFYGYNNNQLSNKIWEEKLFSMFNMENDNYKRSFSSYGYILITNFVNTYVITFGRANTTVGKFIDLNFGLEMASKMLDGKTINLQSSKFYALSKSKSITEFTKTNFSSNIGESVDCLIGDIEEISGHNCIEALLKCVNKNVQFSTSVMLYIKDENLNLDNLCSIIFNLNRIYEKYDNRVSIPKLSIIKDKEIELLRTLNEKVNRKVLLKDFKDGNIALSFYNLKDSKFVFKEYVQTYRIFNKRKLLNEYENLTIQDISDCMKEKNINNISELSVEIEDSEGIKERKKVIDLIECTLILENEDEFYNLSSGKWSRYNRKYIETIENALNEIRDIVEFNSNYNFDEDEVGKFTQLHKAEITSISKRIYRELEFNFKISKEQPNTILCDRKKVNNIEICDLYANSNELIHVKLGIDKDKNGKFVSNAGKLIECISQSRAGINEYKNNSKQVKETLNIENVTTATLLLITANKEVIENENILYFDSWRLKINLIEWVRYVREQKMQPKIIIGKIINN